MLGKVTLGLKGHGRGKPGASTQPPRPTEADDAHNKEGSDIEAQQEDPVVARLTLSQMRVARIREERQKISAEKMAAAKQRREEAVLEAPCTSSVVIAAHAAAHAALASDTSIGGRRRPSRERPQVTLPHGQHFPHGSQAVAFLYGAEGTFRAPLGEVRYEWNVHLEHASARQPCNPAAIDAAVTLVHHTTRDRDGNLLLDPTRSGEMASGREGSGIEDGAFCEAAALGSVGQVVGRARLLFLFDDNLLGHAVAKVYGRRLPSGIAGASQAARIGTITRFQCLLAGVPSPAVGLRVPEAFLSQIESFWAASLRPSPIATAVLKGSWHLLHESTADAISTFHTLRRLSEAKSDPLHPDPKLQTLKPRTNP
ncbi:hypothetical protein T484DRAFT_3107346 [Baffinella frigidus]|nr:hypothetical protein T484DRAFT_3107346 [Cryptophyta sp. CCMP2293]